MSLNHSLTAGTLAILFVALTAAGGEPEKPSAKPPTEEGLLRELEAFPKTIFEVPPGYRWENEAKRLKLGENEVEFLAKNKVLMSDQAVKQVFTPYLDLTAPVFITSDSLLNGYHV